MFNKRPVGPIEHDMRFKLTYLVAVAFLVGCQSPPRSGPVVSVSWSEGLMSREIRLSAKQPMDSDSKIRLVSIADDSTTTIRLSSGETYSGKPQDYFPCKQFGTSGLQLLSTSRDAETAIFRLNWSETR